MATGAGAGVGAVAVTVAVCADVTTVGAGILVVGALGNPAGARTRDSTGGADAIARDA